MSVRILSPGTLGFVLALSLLLPGLGAVVETEGPSRTAYLPGIERLSGALGLQAQDVEKLGERYGTPLPPAYWTEVTRDPRAFHFQREGSERLLHIQTFRGGRFPDLVLRQGEVVRSLGPRDVPLVGIFRFPLVLGLFADAPGEPAFTAEAVQREFFDGPNSYAQTLPELYREMSGGRVDLRGETFPWVRTELEGSQVTLGASGLVSSPDRGVAAFVESIVRRLDEDGVDWSRFDNTGDGFVDVLAIMHPGAGAECGARENIWSHRWNLRSASQGRLDPGIPTSTPNPRGSGVIHVNDYIIQPVLACGEEGAINRIGVFAHELGHGFGLPDLYGTRGTAVRGAGRWDLMASGTWGCQGEDPARPCHMGAWSKAMLGWVDVVDVAPGERLGEVSLPPVQSSGQVLRVTAQDGSGEYLLLENRQRIGSDANLWEPGLLIWHVDPTTVDPAWPQNSVNNDSNRLGVWLRQADGRNELAGAGPSLGDPGDPFPGCIKEDYFDYFRSSVPCLRTNTEFHFASEPAAWTHRGEPFGVALTGIRLRGEAPHDVVFDLSARVEPEVALDGLVNHFLRPGEPSPLTARQREFLDRNGNRDGRYDVGDFRRFLVEHGGGGR